MRNLRKTSILFCTLILGLFTACNLGLINKTGKLYFDFSEFSTAKGNISRAAIEDVLESGKTYYISLSIEGSYKFHKTINLNEVSTFTIENIPVGSKIKASLVLYTYKNMADPTSQEIVLTGESKKYTINPGVNEILINMQSKFIKLYVTRNESIQDKIDWIAQNGNPDKDYKIILTGYDNEPFNEAFEFKESLNNRANSITLTSDNPYKVALKTDHYYATDLYGIIIVNTYTQIHFENIKISPDCNFPILLTKSTSYVVLGYGTTFTDNKEHNYAINMDGGQIHMIGNACITGFKAVNGGAVLIDYGSFFMYENSRIENCEATSCGGAIYLSYSGSNNFELDGNAKINNCKAGSYGGAIFLKAISIKITSGSITNCTAGTSGGAIYADETNTQPVIYIKGGEIKGNKANFGSAIYLEGEDSQVVLSDDACIDLSNDIYSHGQSIKLANSLKTQGKAAVITYNSLSENQTVLEYSASPYSTSDTNAVKNSYKKFYTNQSNESVTNNYYLSQEGKTVLFNEFLSAPSGAQDIENQIQLGDIVFADNSRIRATDFDKIDYKLYSSIAGIVFYVGSDDGLIGNFNLIVGTETYEDHFERTYYSTNSAGGYAFFNRLNITSFPFYESGYIDPDKQLFLNQNKKRLSEIQNSHFPRNELFSYDDQPISGNTRIETYYDNIVKNNSDFPLYKKIIEYGNKFDSTSKYSINSTNKNNNWFIPTILQYKLFNDVLSNSDFNKLYRQISNSDLSGDYISETIMWNQNYNSQYPSVHQTYLHQEYWPYNFGINFDEQEVIQVVTPPYYDYVKYKAFPIHIYEAN